MAKKATAGSGEHSVSLRPIGREIDLAIRQIQAAVARLPPAARREEQRTIAQLRALKACVRPLCDPPFAHVSQAINRRSRPWFRPMP